MKKLLKLLQHEPSPARFENIRRDAYSLNTEINENTLTVGCEFEFLVCVHQPDRDVHTIDWAKNQVLAALRQPRLLKCGCCRSEFQHHLKVGEIDQEEHYHKWQVDDDITVHGGYPGGYDMFPMEVKSRVLKYRLPPKDASKCKHEPSYIQEMESAIERINTWFDGKIENYDRMRACVLTNDSCGMHVHIGNGIGNPIPFNVVKRVLAFSVENEKIIEELHSVDRIGGTRIITQTLDNNPAPTVYRNQRGKELFNQPLSSCFLELAYRSRLKLWRLEEGTEATIRAKEEADPKCAYDIGKWAEWLSKVDDVEILSKELFYGHGRNCVVNVTECPSRKHTNDQIMRKKLTIEFRQHCGTLLPTLTTSFVNLVANIVLKCADTNDNAFYEGLHGRSPFPAEGYKLENLCKALKCDKSTTETYKALREHKENPITEALDREYSLSRVKKNERRAFDARLPLRDALDTMQETKFNRKKNDAAIYTKLKHGGYGQFDKRDLLKLFDRDVTVDLPHLVKGWRSRVTSGLLQARAERLNPTPTVKLEGDLKTHAVAPPQQDFGPVASGSKPPPSVARQGQGPSAWT